LKENSKLSILIVGRALQILIALISIKISTKLLSANEIGNLYLILSIASFFGLFLVNPIGQYINRKTHQWHDESNLINIMYIYNIYIIAISLFSIFITYLMHHLSIGTGIDLTYFMFFIALFIYFSTWNQTIIPMINMLEYRIAFVVFTLASQLLFLALAYFLINIFGPLGVFWFLGQAISFGIVAVIAMIYFTRNIQSNFNFSIAHKMISIENLKEVLKFSAPLSIGVLFLWMQTQSYGVIIEKYIGAEFLGYFGVGIAVALAISSAFEAVIMQYLYPKMYESMKDENKFSIVMSNILNLIIPIYFLLAIFVSIFSIYIMAILVDVKYIDSYIYTIFGIWISFFRMSSNMLANIAHAKLKTKELIYPYIIGGTIAVIGVIISTNSENYNLYIPLSLVFAGVANSIFMYVKMNRLVKIDLRMKNLYFILFYSIPFMAGLFFYDNSNNILHSFFIVGIFGFYFLYILYLLIKKVSKDETEYRYVL
jgi:O-antigen/teichoic acid export membrane protein